MNDFDAPTWVAFSDLSGLKAMYAKDPVQATEALNTFYNTVYELQDTNNPINSIVVSDCAVFWIDRDNCVADLGTLLAHLKTLHKRLLPEYLLRTSIAYGHFKYEQRLEMPRIRKDMIIGAAYLDAYANNGRIEHGAIVVVKLPTGVTRQNLHLPDATKNLLRQHRLTKSFYEYFWSVLAPAGIKDFLIRREQANEATFSQLKQLYASGP